VSERYTVRVCKEDLVFSAAHFITFDGGECERLHGHNYRVAVELEGRLGDQNYVFDFIALHRMTRGILHFLDHRMLVAAKNPFIHAEIDETKVVLLWRAKEWVFPRSDCIVLDIENTTAELLAKYISDRLLEDLRVEYGFTPLRFQVEVEENFGHWARVSID
jgi:6-pyruvoyltetrahydropterin/6-carboxytetrahydropterin synthase